MLNVSISSSCTSLGSKPCSHLVRYAVSPVRASSCVISLPRCSRLNADFSQHCEEFRATNVRPTSVTYREDKSRSPWPRAEACPRGMCSSQSGSLGCGNRRYFYGRLIGNVSSSQPVGCAHLGSVTRHDLLEPGRTPLTPTYTHALTGVACPQWLRRGTTWSRKRHISVSSRVGTRHT